MIAHRSHPFRQVRLGTWEQLAGIQQALRIAGLNGGVQDGEAHRPLLGSQKLAMIQADSVLMADRAPSIDDRLAGGGLDKPPALERGLWSLLTRE